jgi:hypothetical protein
MLEDLDKILERNMVFPRGDSWLDVGIPYSHAEGDDYINRI